MREVHPTEVAQDPIITWRPSFVCACPRATKVLVAATAAGLLTGFFGVGGGFVVVPSLVLALGFTMPVAVGTSLLVISINSASALVARVGDGLDRTGRSSARSPLLVAVALYTAARSIPALV